jgi:hypothetical protein
MRDSTKAIFIGVAVSLLSTLLLGGLNKLGTISLWSALGTKLVWQPGAVTVVSQDSTHPDHPRDDVLGVHDICTLSMINIQSKGSWAYCTIDQRQSDRVWEIHALHDTGGNQAVCQAICADFK